MKIGVTEAVNYEKKYFVDLEIGTFFKRTKANENGWYVKVSEDENNPPAGLLWWNICSQTLPSGSTVKLEKCGEVHIPFFWIDILNLL